MSREAMPRLVTVWSPAWSVAAARAAVTAAEPTGSETGVATGSTVAGHTVAVPDRETGDEPVVVVRANRIVARSPGAARAGIVVGQRRRDAQRCCPEVRLVDHDPARDAREYERVVRAVADLVPRLDVVEPGWLTFAARGPSRYFGGDPALAERLAALVARLTGWPVGVGVADGRAASTVAARRAAALAHGAAGSTEVVAPGCSSSFLAPLPLRWAVEIGDAPLELVDLLGRLGIRTFGGLAELGPGDVLARFGPQGAHLHRLAAGADLRPPIAVDPPADRCIERVFTEPVDQQSLVVFAAKQLADELVAVLTGEGRVCTRLHVLVETDHGERSERTWYRDGGLSAPAMVERVRWQLDGWLAGPEITAGVVLLRLVPAEVRGDDGVQTRLWGGRSRADDDAHRAITRLVGLAGAEAVTVPVLCGGRLPAERVKWEPVTSVDLDEPESRLASRGEPWPGTTPAPSPAIVLRDPDPIELLDEQGQVVGVGGRGELDAVPATVVIDGRVHRVAEWAGPWPLDQRWWEPRRHRRLARLQLVTDDGVAYLVCVEHTRWWLLAIYA